MILTLRGAARMRYVTVGARLVGDRRINRNFVPATELRRLFEHLAPTSGLDARDHLDVSATSGLPTLPEFLRARARVAHAAGDEGPGLERFVVDARVRRAAGRAADLKVVVDRFDPSRSLFRRATLEIAVDDCADIAIADERATLSGALRDTLFRFATADPTLLLLRISDVRGATVSSVTLGITGPLLFDGIEAGPAPPGAMVLCCTQRRVWRAGAELAETTDRIAVCERAHLTSVKKAMPSTVVFGA